MNLRKTILIRYAVILTALVVFSLAIVSKIMIIQFVKADKWSKEIERLENRTKIIQGNRGNICSSDGRVLATSVPYYEIRFDLGAEGVQQVFADEVHTLAGQLSTVFRDRSHEQFKRELRKAYAQKNRYYLVHPRKVNFDELQKIKDFAIFDRGKIKGGFMPEQEYIRVTPHGRLAFRTIGLMNKGGETGLKGASGISGIEEHYEDYLRGGEGIMVQQNLSGRWVNITTEEPENGKDVLTTIDILLQDMVEDALKRQLIRSDAEYGTAILMEVSTGKIKAIANLGRQNGEYNEIYNYAFGHEGANEPGSTFKLMAIMAAIEDGLVDTSDVYDIEDGKWKIYDKIIYDSDYGHGEHGKLSVKQIFERSSNVGMAKLVTECYKGRERNFINRIYSFGLDEALGIEFKGEAQPYIKNTNDKSWSGTTLAYMSQGYELSLSPLQVLTFYNAVANNGKMMKPMFVEAISQNGRVVKRYSPKVLKSSVCSGSTLRRARALLEGVVENGTAKVIKTNRYRIAGKTGTAKIANRNKGYAERRYRASFAGYFPADKPKYSCLVVVSDPKGAFYGSSVAAPVFKTIADRVYASDKAFETVVKKKTDWLDIFRINKKKYVPPVFNGHPESTEIICKELGIKRSSKNEEADWVYTQEKNGIVELQPRKISENKMPNVVGMGASDAIYLIEKAGLRAKINGVGVVKKQWPDPGYHCHHNQTATIELGRN
jgi:cell division protein FtsI (penicillin-binding protein 3)